MTFLSFDDLDDVFTYFGKLPDIFKVGDEVNIEYVQKYVKGEYDKRITGIYHQKTKTYCNPLVDFFPSTETVRENYKQLNWTYNSNIRPFWVIHNNEVYLFSKKNGGTYGNSICILKPKCNIKYVKSNDCDFYLNELDIDSDDDLI